MMVFIDDHDDDNDDGDDEDDCLSAPIFDSWWLWRSFPGFSPLAALETIGPRQLGLGIEKVYEPASKLLVWGVRH